MAALDELIDKIEDKELRKRILEETNKLRNQRKFGLVFEDHIPECTPLYGVEIKKGGSVALKNGQINDVFDVLSIEGKSVYCRNRKTGTTTYKNISELVAVAEFGDPIYPNLQKIDSVCNAPDNDLWHTLIEADNYHALQLLEYLYAGKVDCIYIDPPYNTGAKDWKYNNNYVDSSDAYRHSKWLSFIEKRVKLAVKLLNPVSGILIITIDDNEIGNLDLLLSQICPEYLKNIITIQMNPGGTQGKQFSVTNEYAFVLYKRDAKICKQMHFGGDTYNLRRWGSTSTRYEGATCFYPVIVDHDLNIVSFGNLLPDDEHPKAQCEEKSDGYYYVWPIDVKGIERKWRYARSNVDSVRSRMHAEKVGDRIEIILTRVDESPKTVWVSDKYNSETYGSKLLKKIIINHRFPYPKSLYAVEDCIKLAVNDNPKALIVDFFAGSGTTLHAVNLLNAEDGGHRQCIIITNNEVSEEEAKALSKKGYHPGDEEWEKNGIARYVTWPRTVCSVEGHDINGTLLKGNYLGMDGQKETGQPMADGFKANCIYFKLGFLDKNAVSLGRQLCELVPLLWMKAGAIGECPEIDRSQISQMLFFPKNKMAILVKESYYSRFIQELQKQPEIQTIFIVTDSDDSYREMIKPLRGKTTYQLYRDYLDNFKINGGNL